MSTGWVSGFLCYLFNSKDEHHVRATQSFQKYSSEGYFLATCDYVLDELLTWMRASCKMPVGRIHKFLRSFELGDLQIYRITQDLFGQALKVMMKYKDHYFSMTDCISFLVMKELKTKNVFTTDKHFAAVGYNNLLLN